jgi:hypothetical protein
MADSGKSFGLLGPHTQSGKLTILLLVLLALFLSGRPAEAQYGGGFFNDTATTEIYTAEHMNTIGTEPNDWDKYLKLMEDIDLASYTGTDFNIIGYIKVEGTGREGQVVDSKPFTGVFDGNGHTISNFSYTSTDTDRIGLFGYVADPQAEIKDLALIDPIINAAEGVGSLIGSMSGGAIVNCYVEGGSVMGTGSGVGGLVGSNSGTITNCYAISEVSGVVSGQFPWDGGVDVAGLVGTNLGTITNCYSTGSATGVTNVGGLVGSNGGTISNCTSSGSVSGIRTVGGLVGGNSGTITNCTSAGSISGSNIVGGLVGGTNFGTITNSHSSANVSGERQVGGLVGDNGYSDTITNCYSTGCVSGDNYVGGLVGWNGGGIITNSYSLGRVTGAEYVGGLVGYNWNLRGTITNCYSAGNVLGTTDVGGLVGWNEGSVTGCFWDIQTSEQSTSAGGTGKTTSEMQIESTFTAAGWDFVGERVNGTEDIWTFYEGTNYPRLAWDNEPGEPVTPPPYGGGTGTQANPYLIYTAEQFNMIGLLPCDWGRHFKLMADIDLSGLTGTDFNIIGYARSWDDKKAFTGVFDGNGKKIYDFSYTSTDRDYVGLFAYVDGENALIKDLGLIDPNIDAGTSWKLWRVASLVAINSGTVSNCYVQGGTVSGNEDIGGLVGNNLNGTITDCYSATNVSGNLEVGGLVGENSSGTITNCYSTASVSGPFIVGGLVGSNGGTITNSFWDIETSGQSSSAGGTGKTTAEMQTESTFADAGWDFVGETANGTEDIWSICEGTNYPRLTWQISAGDFVCPAGIAIEDFVFFIEHWQDNNCDLSNNYCDGTDLDQSGTVDTNDLEILVDNWQAGIE